MVKFQRKVLKNGMTVLFEKRDTGVVSVSFATKYGGIDEMSEERGIAHLIEHLLYKGTTNRTSKQISEAIENKGGVMNAFTSEQVTAFWCKIPSNHLKIALEVLTDMIKNSLFDEKEIDKEKHVIFSEMQMWKDSPQLYISYKIRSCLYDGVLGSNLIGTEKSLNGLTREKILQRYKEAYSTNNLILCVVGDANFDEICKFAEENFEKTTHSFPQPKVILQNKKVIEKRKGIDQANLILAYHIPKASEKKYYIAQVLSTIMAGGMSSRLFQEIREKRNLAYVIRSSCNCDKDFGYDAVYVGTKKENIGRVRRLILDEFKKIKDLREKELNDAKEQLMGNNKISNEDSQGQMLELLYSEIFGNARESYEYGKNIKKVKLSDVKKLANFKNYSIFALVPS